VAVDDAMTGTVDLPVVRPELELYSSFQPLEGCWNDLAAASRNVFASLEFLRTWWLHFGNGRNLLIAAWHAEDGSLVGILPLYEWSKRPVTIVRFVGHGAGDELGPICAPGHRDAVVGAFRRFCAESRRRWDVLVAENLPGEGQWAATLNGRVVRREGSPVIRSSGNFEEFLATRSQNFRQQVRRRERRLFDGYEVRYRMASDPRRFDDDVATLFSLHRSRWGAESAFTGRREAFHRDFARQALVCGWARLWLLELDGSPVAAWYGFRFGDVDSYYQAGRADGFEADSLGFVLLAHTIRESLNDGLAEYRMLRGHDPYKYRFATEDQGLDSVAIAGGRLGVGVVAAARLARRSRRARRALHAPLQL
jgi:CelD/BcsL family acetyltransferase involved in cellulose biosynthesis